MKRLTQQECAHYRDIITNEWRTHKLHDIPARFEAPLGEIVENLAGFAAVWKLRNEMPCVQDIEKSDRFNAQGIEGKIVKHTDLTSAITYYFSCDKNRAAVYV